MVVSKLSRWGGPGAWFVLITLAYLVMLAWGDSQKDNWGGQEVRPLFDLLPTLLGITLTSYLIRYFRWQWLLLKAEYRLSFFAGFIAYLSGFAYTASPGKVGELVRVRYFDKFGVPSDVTIAAFIFERSFDLLAVLLLSVFLFHQPEMVALASGFVVLLLGAVIFCMSKPGFLEFFERACLRVGLNLIAKAVRVLKDGFVGCRVWLNPADITVSLLSALLSWGLVAIGFISLLGQFENDVPAMSAFSIYPLSMLIGAASMIPGGVGSTEASIIFLLRDYGVELGSAITVAVGIRLTTLWFGILIGFACMVCLEWRYKELPKSLTSSNNGA